MGLVKARAPAEEPLSSEVSATAATALRGEKGQGEAAPAAVSVEDLVARLREDGDGASRETLWLSLLRIGTAEAARGLAQFLGSDDPGLRNGALESLRGLPVEAAQLLSELGRNADPDVRIFAALLATDFPQPWITQWLIEQLAAETLPNVAAAIAEVLGERGDPLARPALLAMRVRFADEPFLQFTADIALDGLRAA